MKRGAFAVLLAAPLFLVPAIEIPLAVWAREAFLARSPDYLLDPPTISRAINDPVIGIPFAQVILLITALVALGLPLVLWAYRVAIDKLKITGRRRRVMQSLLALLLVLQVAASSGMVLTTQFTFATDRDLHMLGSYVFFTFQALTVLAGGTLCAMLYPLQRRSGPTDDYPLLPGMHRFRQCFAVLVAMLAMVFGALFVLKDLDLPVSAYWLQLAFTQSEILVIAAFVLFHGSYGVDIHAMVKRGLFPPRDPD